MAVIKSCRGFSPKIGKGTMVAENATIVGNVEIGEESSVWFGAVIRGDVNAIRIGKRCNIQDGAVLHATYDLSPHPSVTILGDGVSVGHNAIIHGAQIGDNCLIGMGATVLDNAKVGEGCIIAANALVLSGAVLEPGGLYAGVPAKRLKEVTPEQRVNTLERTTRDYMTYANWFPEYIDAEDKE